MKHVVAGLVVAGTTALVAFGCDKLRGYEQRGTPADAHVVQTLCASDLGGPRAELHVWRDDKDVVVLFELIPDENGPESGATAIYDSRGREQLRLPPVPDPGSPQALDTERRRDMVFEDSHRRETISCRPDAGRH